MQEILDKEIESLSEHEKLEIQNFAERLKNDEVSEEEIKKIQSTLVGSISSDIHSDRIMTDFAARKRRAKNKSIQLLKQKNKNRLARKSRKKSVKINAKRRK